MKMLVAALALLSCPFIHQSAMAVENQEVIFDREGRRLPDSDVNSSTVNWKLLSLATDAAYNGVGLVDIFNGGGCTGTLIDTGAVGDAPAYALSNGHCAGPQLMGPSDIRVDLPAPGRMNFRLNFFVDAGHAVRIIPIRRIVYATMKSTDISIFELDVTLRELVAAGFRPHKIDGVDPAAGTRVELIGVPQNGVKRATRFLRRSVCQIGDRTNLIEGGYHFQGSFRHGCSSVGGSSGSPMLSVATGNVVAINNTGVDDKAMNDPECAIDRPCEVAADGSVHTYYNTNYAQKTSDIPSCFDADGTFNLKLAGCRLERP